MACLQKTKLFMIWEPRSCNNQNERQPHMHFQDDVDYERLKFLIKHWAGPNHDPAQGHSFDLPFVSYMCVLETISL